jgi:pilus assembly protein Flp/PilA
MKSFVKKLRRFLRSEHGPTAVEYVVMLSLIVLVCLAAIRVFGTNTNATFQNIASSTK